MLIGLRDKALSPQIFSYLSEKSFKNGDLEDRSFGKFSRNPISMEGYGRLFSWW